MSYAQLRADVIALLGESTIDAAEAERDTLVAAATDERVWRSLAFALSSLSPFDFDGRRALCAKLDERTRRMLALAILDRRYMFDIARAIARET